MVGLGELFRTFGPTLVPLAPHIKKAALYLFIQRDSETEYGERFRALLAFSRADLRWLIRSTEEIRDLCVSFGINTQESGSMNRIDVRLNWYVALRQRRVLKRAMNLTDEIRDSIDGITDVIACFLGLTAGIEVEEGIGEIPNQDYEDSEAVAGLTAAEYDLVRVMGDPESSIETFIESALRFLQSCDEVLSEFTEGIEVEEIP